MTEKNDFSPQYGHYVPNSLYPCYIKSQVRSVYLELSVRWVTWLEVSSITLATAEASGKKTVWARAPHQAS